MHYYGTRLSENISRREPEGYLLCLNVPVARTGIQEYLPAELSMAGSAPVPVYRPEEEVFSEATLASFEGMPVTNDHPPDGVDVFNIRALQKGHAHNVRRGSGEESDLLLADLIITDPALITAILEDGKREISCGYTYELCEENGRYIQRKIRGNHVAVVDAGRAGARVSIKDEHPSESLIRVTDAMLQPSIVARRRRSKDGSRRSHEHPVQISDLANRCRATGAREWRAAGDDKAAATIAKLKTTKMKGDTPMKKSLSKVLARMAKDGDIETVAEIIEEMIEPETEPVEAAEAVAEAVVEAAEPEDAPVVENAETVIAVDESTLEGIVSRLDRIIALLTPAAEDDLSEEVAEAVEEIIEASEVVDPVAEEVSAAMEEVLDPVASVILEAEEDEEENPLPETLQTGDALRAALAAVRPVLARMPKNARRKIAGDIAARIRSTGRRSTTGTDAYAALASARRRTAPASADLGRKIMEKRNVNYHK